MTVLGTAAVTGANSGIGLETVRAWPREGVPDASQSIVLCDLSLQADVRRAAAEIEAKNERLDLLVSSPPRSDTAPS